MFKELYAKLVNTSNKMNEVVVRENKMVYYKETINRALGLHNVGDTYQHLLETANDQDLDTLMESLCNPCTKWINSGLEKIIRRMDLFPDPKA